MIRQSTQELVEREGISIRRSHQCGHHKHLVVLIEMGDTQLEGLQPFTHLLTGHVLTAQFFHQFTIVCAVALGGA